MATTRSHIWSASSAMRSGKRRRNNPTSVTEVCRMSEQTIDESGVTAAERAEARRYSMVISWSDEDEAFIVRFPDAPGVVTYGTTLEEATEQGEDAIITWLTGLHDADLPVPPPLTARTAVIAAAPRFDAAHIQQLRHRLNVSQRAFAEMLNV